MIILIHIKINPNPEAKCALGLYAYLFNRINYCYLTISTAT
jgi:hypothetical protein